MPATPQVLPDPWFPSTFMEAATKISPVSVTGGAIVGANNEALFNPVVFPCDCTLYSLSVRGTNATGNYDLGFYDYALNRLASKGSTAMANAVLTLTLPEIRVIGGELYYAAFASNNTGSNIIRGSITPAGLQSAHGFGQQLTAFPLPNPGVPSASASGVIPIFAFGIR